MLKRKPEKHRCKSSVRPPESRLACEDWGLQEHGMDRAPATRSDGRVTAHTEQKGECIYSKWMHDSIHRIQGRIHLFTYPNPFSSLTLLAKQKRPKHKTT